MQARIGRFTRCCLFITAIITFTASTHGQDTKSIVSSDKIFMVSYPTSWKVNKLDGSAELSVSAPGASMSEPCMARMLISPLSEGYENFTIKQLADVELKMMKAQENPKEKTEVKSSEFKKEKNKEWWIVKTTTTKGKKVYYATTYKTIHNKKTYILNYIATEKDYETFAASATKIFESIDFLTPDNSSK